MNMNRRSAIRYFIIVGAGVALLPTCKPSPKKISAYNNIPIDEDQQALLAAIAETIIPDTNTPGAKEISAHLFVLQMLNDCYEQKDRDRFLKGMQQFGEDVNKNYKRSFTECTEDDRKKIIAAMNTQKDPASDAVYFYNTFKGLTIQAYTTSKYYLTNVQEYKLVPGKFKSSVPV
jgi:hypothetical protein